MKHISSQNENSSPPLLALVEAYLIAEQDYGKSPARFT